MTIIKLKQLKSMKSKTTHVTEKSVTTTENQDSKSLIAGGEKEKTEQLIERDEVENTPFTIITMNGESFGTFGKYKITENYHTKQQCRVELLKVDWNRIVQITTLINVILNEKK